MKSVRFTKSHMTRYIPEVCCQLIAIVDLTKLVLLKKGGSTAPLKYSSVN